MVVFFFHLSSYFVDDGIWFVTLCISHFHCFYLQFCTCFFHHSCVCWFGVCCWKKKIRTYKLCYVGCSSINLFNHCWYFFPLSFLLWRNKFIHKQMAFEKKKNVFQRQYASLLKCIEWNEQIYRVEDETEITNGCESFESLLCRDMKTKFTYVSSSDGGDIIYSTFMMEKTILSNGFLLSNNAKHSIHLYYSHHKSQIHGLLFIYHLCLNGYF